jgi:N-acetylneuraminic acid mutarotase
MRRCKGGDGKVETISSNSESPQPRVGSAITTLAGKLYMFSGRGGVEMAPLEEHGKLWVFDTGKSNWSQIAPNESGAPYPEGRSYHAMTGNGSDTLYVHAGCPEHGRLSDLWEFNIESKKWKKLADAPGPSRGGPSLAYLKGHVYRMNGFDGKTEQGGSLDRYDPSSASWTTTTFPPNGKAGPIARSVCSLLAVQVFGRPSLVTLFGESDPSNLRHAGAGKMLDDIWAFDVESEVWQRLKISGLSPPPRGWFDADVVGDNEIVVSGGLAESNARLDDIWLLTL